MIFSIESTEEHMTYVKTQANIISEMFPKFFDFARERFWTGDLSAGDLFSIDDVLIILARSNEREFMNISEDFIRSTGMHGYLTIFNFIADTLNESLGTQTKQDFLQNQELMELSDIF